MPQIRIKSKAPDFSLSDFRGRQIHLSDYLGKENVVLVFNRGFV
jgi:peroxiredoxin